MVTSSQDQSVSENSTAIQAAGDVNYSVGISPAQMIEIIDAIKNLVQVHTEQSKEVIEQRLEGFRNALIKEFSEIGKGKVEAFSDPDFQGALLDAQKSIARNGGASLEEVLVDLVSQRSKCVKRDRLSLTLNDAILKAGLLTDEDFDFLALIFIFKNMQIHTIYDIKSLTDWFKNLFDPVAFNCAEGELAVSYLESHGCLRTVAGGVINFDSGFELLIQRYPGAITRGFRRDQLEQIFSPESPFWRYDFFKPSPLGTDLLVVSLGDAKFIDHAYERLGLAERPGSRYADMAKQNPMTENEFIDVASVHFDRIQGILRKYDDSGARASKLTSVGLALAHARLSKFKVFDAPLSVWVK